MSQEPNYTLFGEVVPVNHGARGRPEHVPSEENRNRIAIALADGWSNKRIAQTLGISLPTLRKHYKFLVQHRKTMRDRLELRARSALYQQGLAGNVAAMKEYFRRADASIPDMFDADVRSEVAKLGKKEQRLIDAKTPPDEWQDLAGMTSH